MWWSEPPRQTPLQAPRLGRLAVIMLLAGLTAGCFQPLYGEKTPTGGTGIVDRLSSVEVAPVDTPNGTRLSLVGVEVRGSLIFGLPGDGATPAASYELAVRLTAGQTQV